MWRKLITLQIRQNITQRIFFHIKNKLQDPLEHRRLLALKVLSKIEGDKAIKLINISANDSSKIKSLAISALIGRVQTER